MSLPQDGNCDKIHLRKINQLGSISCIIPDSSIIHTSGKKVFVKSACANLIADLLVNLKKKGEFSDDAFG